MKIISPLGTTEHDTNDALQAKREHKSKFGLDGIDSKDSEIMTEAEFNAQRKAEHDAVKDATVAAPDKPLPIVPDHPPVEARTSAEPQPEPEGDDDDKPVRHRATSQHAEHHGKADKKHK